MVIVNTCHPSTGNVSPQGVNCTQLDLRTEGRYAGRANLVAERHISHMLKKTISSHRLESTLHALGKSVQDLSVLMQKRFDAVDRRFTEVTEDICRMVKQ